MTDFNYATATHVHIQRVNDGPITYPKLTIKCAEEGCSCTFCKRLPGRSPLPVEALRTFASHAGWTSDKKGKTFFCPEHST